MQPKYANIFFSIFITLCFSQAFSEEPPNIGVRGNGGHLAAIIDWDYTLFFQEPTIESFMDIVEYRRINYTSDQTQHIKGIEDLAADFQRTQAFQSTWKQQDDRVHRFLSELVANERKILILTDATMFWVIYSAYLALPRTYNDFIFPLIQSDNIISSKVYRDHPSYGKNSSYIRKSLAILDLLPTLQRYDRIVSIGDGPNERMASSVLYHNLNEKQWQGTYAHIEIPDTLLQPTDFYIEIIDFAGSDFDQGFYTFQQRWTGGKGLTGLKYTLQRTENIKPLELAASSKTVGNQLEFSFYVKQVH